MLEIIGLLLPGITGILNKLIPDTNARAAAQDEITKLLISQSSSVNQAIAEAAKAQAEINLAEAQNPSVFVSGWRPAVAWICVAGCFYSFIFQPTTSWVFTVVGLPSLPILDTQTIIGLLSGLLGLAGFRTFEKIQGVAENTLAAKRK